MKQIIISIQYLLLYFIVFVMAISYHPAIVRASSAAGIESGTILSRYILVLFVLLFLVSLFRIPREKCSLINIYLLLSFLVFFFSLLIVARYDNREMFSSLRAILIAFASVIVGWTLDPSEKQIQRIVLVFGITVVFTGLMQVFTNIGGFVINNQYLTDNKNSLGAMLASASVSFLYVADNPSWKAMRAISLVLAILSLIIIITIRARSALLATFLVGVLFVALRYRHKGFSAIVFFFLLLLSILFIIPSGINDYLYASIFAGYQGDDVSSGRIGTYRVAIDFIMQNPFWGDVENRTQIPWIHNYPLLNVYQFGLLFSWPILLVYIYLLIHAIRFAFKQNNSFLQFGYTVFLIPFIISLFEPTFPFGPGTVTVYNFILLGISERKRKQ